MSITDGRICTGEWRSLDCILLSKTLDLRPRMLSIEDSWYNRRLPYSQISEAQGVTSWPANTGFEEIAQDARRSRQQSPSPEQLPTLNTFDLSPAHPETTPCFAEPHHLIALPKTHAPLSLLAAALPPTKASLPPLLSVRRSIHVRIYGALDSAQAFWGRFLG